MDLDDDQIQRLKDVAATGEALGKMRPLFSTAPLPLPFRLPSSTSWAQTDPNDASEPDDEFGDFNAGGASSEDFDDDGDDDHIDDVGDEKSGDKSNTALAPALAGISADVGTTRATCAFLIHGDPAMHRMTNAVLAWSNKQDRSYPRSKEGNS